MTPASAAQAAVARVPGDVWLRVFSMLEPHDILAARQDNVAVMPDAPRAPAAVALPWPIMLAQRREQRWRSGNAVPRRVFRIRAHVSRITTLQLVTGACHVGSRVVTDRWLITGSVDGFVRVWDLGALRGYSGPLDVTHEMADPDEEAPAPSDPAQEIRKHAKALLIAEADTGGDVTAIDASFEDGALTIAVGSYYSAAACLVYVLDLGTKPHTLDLRAALDAPQWCGTQCVSLCGDCVAVGTHMDGVHVLNWQTGWRGVVQRTDRTSTAAVRLTANCVVVVTRLGALKVYDRPRDDAPGELLAQHELTDGRPFLSVALGQGAPSIPILILDESTLTEHALKWTDTAPYAPEPPTTRGQHKMPPERISGLAAGVSARNAVVLSSGGGVPPRCCVRAFSADIGRMWPLRPAPVVTIPGDIAHDSRYVPTWPRRDSDTWSIRSDASDATAASLSASSAGGAPGAGAGAAGADAAAPAASPAASPAQAPRTDDSAGAARAAAPESPSHVGLTPTSASSQPPSPRPPRVDSFSAGAPPPMRTLPSTRTDMLTEAYLDEAYGLLCLASARGAVWIADYSGTTT
ncbi:hypothetical protein MCUN1_002352 [Malassezia cuniculi]|uniref:Uncharacterized protein n=1 Tax=Malassezia cuniculi TaxID=948313 RepID=A0AAF0ERT6_9BASI|nr:hypothetical protein MCUN1_002352 [Malassezia cuniculi]